MTRAFVAAIVWWSIAAAAGAQTLPSEPISIGNGRVVLGGDVSAAIAPVDPGFFSYGQYEHSTLRQFRIGLSAQVRAGRRLSLLAEVRSENLEDVTPFALYARVRPFPNHRFDIQVGRIPPTFGRFARLAYSKENPLIGYPLAYQYLTSLRPDSVPASNDELLLMRGRGWRSNFSVGNLAPAPGVPLASSLTWDTGVQVIAGLKAVTLVGSVTNGTLSNPRVGDDNGGKTVAARMVVSAAPGLEIGSSFSRGSFVSRTALDALGPLGERDIAQTAYGLDVEYSRGHWLTRMEAITSGWRMPMLSTGLIQPLRSTAISAEGRYALLPGVYMAVRAEHLGFSHVQGRSGNLPWDAPVMRVELGAGYYIQRNVIFKASLQLNERDGGRTTTVRLPAAQLLFWF
ncbi:MAG TPA: hypothetical protein VFV95_20635 [Vicinamibacterales bacterium]|nr:hypothetical protein [Vicinamibacterales bacterium]